MAYTDIDKPTDYFNTKLYTGDGTNPRAITGVGFQPDWLWIKRRDASGGHNLYDVIRGNTKRLESHNTGAEATTSDISSFDSDGFTVNTTGVNTSSATYVAWNWLASNTTASNTDGSITSSVSANTTAGFSIVSYTGNGSSGATIGHGLGSKPRFIVAKMRDSANNWLVQHGSLGATKRLLLDTTLAESTQPFWGNTEPTSDVFSVGSVDLVNQNGNTYIAYCFAEKKGYSKFGSFLGHAGHEFIYTGFKPAFVLTKRTDGASAWYIWDNKRTPSNLCNKFLEPNTSNAEGTSGAGLDFLSNGFVEKGFLADAGRTLIYMAFAENPFVTSTGIPACAR